MFIKLTVFNLQLLSYNIYQFTQLIILLPLYVDYLSLYNNKLDIGQEGYHKIYSMYILWYYYHLTENNLIYHTVYVSSAR